MIGDLFQLDYGSPWWFLLLTAIPMYIFLAYRKKGKQTFSIGFPDIQKEVFKVKNWKSWLHWSMPIIKSLALLFLIIAMARPQEKFQKQKITSEGIDIMVSLDVSGSMLEKDFLPNRLEAAKDVITRFIKNRASDRIGLTVFAAESYTVTPPTLDHQLLIKLVNEVVFTNTLVKGTAIGMGLANSLNRLKNSDAKSKIVILVTDGENTGGSVEPLVAADIAKSLGIKVYTIGIGEFGRQQVGFSVREYKIDYTQLQEISEVTKGAFYLAKDRDELNNIYDTINELEKSEFDSTTFVRHEDRFFPYLLLGLFLFLFQFILDITLFRNIETV